MTKTRRYFSGRGCTCEAAGGGGPGGVSESGRGARCECGRRDTRDGGAHEGVGALYYGRMAVRFLDPLERGGITEQYSRWYLLVKIVVLVERADRQSVAVLSPIFEGEGEGEGEGEETLTHPPHIVSWSV